MRAISYICTGLALSALVLLFPLSPAAAQVPIGGKVTAIVPCPHLAGYAYAVVGLGIGSGLFWFVPGTIIFPYGPPVVGEWVLGLAAPGGACGLTTEYEGTGVSVGDTSSGADAAVQGHGLY